MKRGETIQRKFKCWNRYSKFALCNHVSQGLRQEAPSFNEAADLLWNTLNLAVRNGEETKHTNILLDQTQATIGLNTLD